MDRPWSHKESDTTEWLTLASRRNLQRHLLRCQKYDLFSFFFVPQGETNLKITLDRTAPMIITVELMALLLHQMHLFCQIIRMRVSVIFLSLGWPYFYTFCPGVFASQSSSLQKVLCIGNHSFAKNNYLFHCGAILLDNSIVLKLMYLGKH